MVHLPQYTKRMAILTDKQSDLWVHIDGYVSHLEDQGYQYDDIVKIMKEYSEIAEEFLG